MLRLVAAALLFAAGAACGAEYRSLGDKPAILYDAPSTRADKLFAVTRFYPFEVLVKLDQWTKVRDANGEVGWIENTALGDRTMVVVTVPLADVRAAPDAQSPLVFEAYKQVLLEIVEPPANGWVKVRHRDGQEGYIRTSHVWGA
ncbi:MAG TPA: SH3 domain-containing protein [Usitatibacter sp.]|jgi:SH3-like domain-containing protein|nr:SH3 domain-containing protein [Usitatibacter sp.]